MLKILKNSARNSRTQARSSRGVQTACLDQRDVKVIDSRAHEKCYAQGAKTAMMTLTSR